MRSIKAKFLFIIFFLSSAVALAESYPSITLGKLPYIHLNNYSDDRKPSPPIRRIDSITAERDYVLVFPGIKIKIPIQLRIRVQNSGILDSLFNQKRSGNTLIERFFNAIGTNYSYTCYGACDESSTLNKYPPNHFFLTPEFKSKTQLPLTFSELLSGRFLRDVDGKKGLFGTSLHSSFGQTGKDHFGLRFKNRHGISIYFRSGLARYGEYLPSFALDRLQNAEIELVLPKDKEVLQLPVNLVGYSQDMVVGNDENTSLNIDSPCRYYFNKEDEKEEPLTNEIIQSIDQTYRCVGFQNRKGYNTKELVDACVVRFKNGNIGTAGIRYRYGNVLKDGFFKTTYLFHKGQYFYSNGNEQQKSDEYYAQAERNKMNAEVSHTSVSIIGSLHWSEYYPSYSPFSFNAKYRDYSVKKDVSFEFSPELKSMQGTFVVGDAKNEIKISKLNCEPYFFNLSENKILIK